MPARITRTSTITGITRTLEVLAYNEIEFEKRYLAYNRGHLTLDEAFPELTTEAREFVRSGVTEEEWQKYIVEGQVIPNRR